MTSGVLNDNHNDAHGPDDVSDSVVAVVLVKGGSPVVRFQSACVPVCRFEEAVLSGCSGVSGFEFL